MRIIPLTRGQSAFVDDADYERLAAHKWCAQWNNHTRSFVATRRSKWVDGKSHIIFMHREILGLVKGDGLKGDHIDSGQTLDNRRLNLRVSTNSQNIRNQRRRVTSRSGYKGVCFANRERKWKAQITVDGKNKSLGLHATPEAAYASYCSAAVLYFGEFARLV
jgi:hypothetical protein